MSKRDTQRLIDQVLRKAAQLEDDERSIPVQDIVSNLRDSGVDPKEVKRRFHAALKNIAARERTAGRPAPLYLPQALDATLPNDQFPADERAARTKAGRWLEQFTEAFRLPTTLQPERAYRKTGELDEAEARRLDEIEQELRQKVQREHEDPRT